tara:strand:+ start:119 stop:1237 length:1119 start_codon:yes stop_codon:yes gene_type:complete
MAIAGTNITLDSTEGMDKITTVEKVTSPYHSDGSETLAAANIVSTSLSDTNEEYFFGISNNSTPTTTEWNVAFGSTSGFGAKIEANTKSETEAIYKQYSSILLSPTEVTGGFIISRNNSLATAPTNAKVASGKDTEIFVLSARRTNMKDRINKGTWTVALSGSSTADAKLGASLLELTDDSVNGTPTATPVGDRYNIVSGTAGTIVNAASDRTYGFFYPDMGIMVFSAAELSASIPGKGANKAETVIFDKAEHKGFGFSSDTNANEKTALRFINCLQPVGAKLSFRDEEDQVSAQYFCRVKSGQANFSNNPTFVSGSENKLRNDKMRGNPQTFITSVQMYNQNQEMVAVANLSTPLKKNFSSEATIKVKLTY